MDAAAKHLAADHATVTVAFGRYLFGAFVGLAIWLSAGRPRISMEMWRTHATRGVVIAGAGFTFFYGLGVLPLADAIVLAYLAPLLTPFAAWVMLGERVRPAGFAAGLIGFAGAVIGASAQSDAARHPDHWWGVAAIITSAVLYAVAVAQLRARAGRDGAAVIGLLQAFIPACVMAPFALTLAPMPDAAALPIFALVGVLGAGGWFFLIKAYARAEAQRLAPIEFTSLAWAALLGAAMFGERPTVEVFVAAALIVLACLISEFAGRRAPRSVLSPEGKP